MSDAPLKRSKNVLVFTYWTFRSGLIQAYTLPYVRMISRRLRPGGRITLVTFEQPSMALENSAMIEARAALAEEGIDWVAFGYRRFGLAALISAGWALAAIILLCVRRRVESIHCFCTPAGAIGSLISLVAQIPLVIDSYEPHAEAMVDYGVWRRSGPAFRLLFALERFQSHRALAVIAAAPAMRDYARSRYGVEFSRFQFKPACVDLRVFCPDPIVQGSLRKELGFEGKIVCVYAGKTGGVYLEREIFEFFRVASDFWGGRFKALVLSSDPEERLRELATAWPRADEDMICRFVDHKDVPRYLDTADFALTPVKPLPIKRYCAPIKNGEYWAMGLPVVSTAGIASDSDLIVERRIGAVLPSLDDDSYREALTEIARLLESENRASLGARIRAVAEETRSMAVAEAVYDRVYGRPADE